MIKQHQATFDLGFFDPIWPNLAFRLDQLSEDSVLSCSMFETWLDVVDQCLIRSFTFEQFSG